MDEIALAVTKSDYYSALADFGITHEAACRQSFGTEDMIIESIHGLETRESPIHGVGLFAVEGFAKGQNICKARIADKRTIAGRYANHAPNRNAFFMFEGDDISLFASEDIAPRVEITVNYRESLALQLQKPTDIIAQTKEIGAHNTDRLLMTGLNAVAYDLFFNDDHIANLSTRERVLAFESLLSCLPQAEIEPKHEFISGLYRREITIKKGTFATGLIHRDDHMDVVLSGKMIVATDDGFAYIEGPCCRTSTAGKKKAGYAIEDTVWVTYHPTSATTVEDVEKELFLDDFEEINIGGAL